MKPVKTPKPPYYAVIFTSNRTSVDNGYSELAEKMETLVSRQKGFLGMEHAFNDGLSITVCYWESLEDIQVWRENLEHQEAQKKGYQMFYQAFATRICKVERDNFFEK